MNATWTIAYRKPRANRFQRVTNWHGTWNDAYAVARAFAEANPDLQVFYVPSLGSENAEDAGTILVDSGKRVRIIDNGALTGEVLAYAVSCLWEDAAEENGCIDEAYAGKAEDAGMSIPAYRACLKGHTAKGEIFLSGLWNTPIAHMHKVVVMDNGARFGVSNADASFFTGEVYDMPKGEIAKCVHCRETVLMPAIESNDSEEKEMDAIKSVVKVANDAITALMPSLIASRTVFESVRDSGVASEEMIGYAYQAYTDTYRAIKEYERTIAYAEDI